jgi:glycosyltransferase involved in cell wall biosynthesis
LTHLFVSYEQEQSLHRSPPVVEHEPWALFFGRLEVYKGVDVLVEAAGRLGRSDQPTASVIIAGRGRTELLLQDRMPANIQVRNRLIEDEEALDLFRRCGLLVLPYVEASQSALIAAAYFFRKPVIVTDVGALTEYVGEGGTGWVIPPGDPQALADALQTALSDTVHLAQMGQAAREWYDSQRQIEEATLQRMYVKLVDRSGDADPGVSTRRHLDAYAAKRRAT